MDKHTQNEIIKIVQRNFEAIAKSSAKAEEKQIPALVAKLAEEVKPDYVLDIGCGSGQLFELFKDKIKYLGIDNCAELLKIAKDKYKNNPNQPEFIINDILNLTKIPQINFDHIFCISMLHYLPDRQLRVQALKQLKNKIKQDGQIIISVRNLWSQPRYRKLIFKFWILKLLKKNRMDFGDILFDWKDPKVHIYTQRYYHAFTIKQLRQLADLAGLKIKLLNKDQYNYCLVLSK
ncbi:MAG: class I SAM-dependent methyltransferase [bacterium]